MLPITNKCNQLCLYCSAHGREETSKEYILRQIESAKDTIIFSGGETTLNTNLIQYIKKAKKRNLYVELQSNGTLFFYKDLAKRTVDAGVDLFNIAMQSHKEKTYNWLTQTKGLLPKKVQGIKNILKLKAKVRITFVINKLNYKELENFTEFILQNFKGIHLLEFNFIKAIGLAKDNKDLVPKYEQVSPYLINALKKCKDQFKVLIDHIPLCYITGFEKMHADVGKIMSNKNQYFNEKEHVKSCNQCTLNKICLGPRKDYIEMHQTKVIPSDKDPRTVIGNKGVLAIDQTNKKIKNLTNQNHTYSLDIKQDIEKAIKQIKSNLDKLIQNDQEFKLQNFPICIFRPYRLYITKTKELKKIRMCTSCKFNQECSGFPDSFLDNKKLKIQLQSREMTDNEKCVLKVLSKENNISSETIMELAKQFSICKDCSSGSRLVWTLEKLQKRRLIEKKLTKKGYIWSRI